MTHPITAISYMEKDRVTLDCPPPPTCFKSKDFYSAQAFKGKDHSILKYVLDKRQLKTAWENGWIYFFEFV